MLRFCLRQVSLYYILTCLLRNSSIYVISCLVTPSSVYLIIITLVKATFEHKY